MSIEELADLTAEKLEALSAEELEAILKPYFNVTRPEQAKKEPNAAPKQKELPVYISPNKMKAIEMLEEEGIDFSFLRNRNKRKKKG